MPNTREKLEVIAHLGDHITYREGIGICYDSALAKVIEDAYMTLKNGVTVQQWIPFTEQPNKMKPVICLYENEDGKQVGGGYVNDHGIWTLIAPARGTITHWMPLPEPPKGE